ncbi:MAG: class I SAM-dependent methyltransferase [Planctomycetota bacterium]
MKAYAQDLAWIHHRGFGGFSRQAAPGILALLRENGVAGGLVADLGCGSGTWARELGRAGYAVLGIDLSSAMIRMAKKQAPLARFRTGSFLTARLPPCDAVTALGEVFNYRFDERNNRRSLGRFFRSVWDSLRPGGLFLFDAAGPERCGGRTQGHWEGGGWTILVDYSHDRRRNRLTRTITTFRRTGRTFRRDREVHVQQLYRATEIARMLRAAGFRARILRGYGSLRFPRGVSGFLARKP